VYGAWSRRAGGPSLGIDLTPEGECSAACVYCQVPRTEAKKGRPLVDTGALRAELSAALAKAPAGGWADLAFAGSGEPTLAANFEACVSEVLASVRSSGFPFRIYTNGLHLGVADVERALASWKLGGGQIWVKLDAVDDAELARLWRVSLSAQAHLRRLWRFARRFPVGIQTTLVTGPGLLSFSDTAERIATELEHAVMEGAKLEGVDLLGPSREPGDRGAASGLTTPTTADLERASAIFRARLNVPVRIYT
jgi:wyosine [tRNA(Phe)-imidazoG37] synthetase (radical SAM superfamily)